MPAAKGSVASNPDVSAALLRVASALADNKTMLGRRYGDWCTGAPLLESAVAAAAMAQDELGHARALYPLVDQLSHGANTASIQEPGWQQFPTHALAALDRPLGGWVEFVAVNFVIDTALTMLCEAASEGANQGLAQRARKILQEEQTHWIHARGWIRRLSRDAVTAPQISAAVARLWPEAMALFGPDEGSDLEVLKSAAELVAGSSQLRERLGDRLSAVLLESGLAVPGPAPIDWSRWSSQTSRLEP